MKNVFIYILLFLSISLYGQDNTFYYWYKGEKKPLQLKENKKFVLFESSSADQAISFLKEKHWQIISKDNDNTINTLNPYQKIERIEKYSWAIIENDGIYNS